jgi:hypothetical protein
MPPSGRYVVAELTESLSFAFVACCSMGVIQSSTLVTTLELVLDGCEGQKWQAYIDAIPTQVICTGMVSVALVSRSAVVHRGNDGLGIKTARMPKRKGNLGVEVVVDTRGVRETVELDKRDAGA